MAKKVEEDILLESGTNEVEIAVVSLGPQTFGINVAKIREFKVFKGLDIKRLPGSHESVAGVFDFREETVPLIQLGAHLNLPSAEESDNPIIVVTEFNNMTAGFITDGITDIHRITWRDFKPLSKSLGISASQVTGSVNLAGEKVLVLDMEQILGEIFPENILNYDERTFADKPKMEERQQAKLFFAEDSVLIRTQITKVLEEIGYTDLRVFSNGQSAYDAVVELKKRAEEEGVEISQHLNLILTDIEMPQMDGLTLCRRVREELELKTPVVIFSSLISEQMAAKCRQVGADGYVAKPETDRLIGLIDSLVRPSGNPPG